MLVFARPERLHVRPGLRAEFAHGRSHGRHARLHVVEQRTVLCLFAYLGAQFRGLLRGSLREFEDRIFRHAGPFGGIDAHVGERSGERVGVGRGFGRGRLIRTAEAPVLGVAAAKAGRILLFVGIAALIVTEIVAGGVVQRT